VPTYTIRKSVDQWSRIRTG